MEDTMKIADLRQEAIRLTTQSVVASNPCRRTLFLNSDTGEYVRTICDSPRCRDCGPLKANLLWQGIELIGKQVTLVRCDNEKEYLRIRDKIRKARQRSGTDYAYVSWVDNGRYVLTDAPIDGERIQTAVIKKRLLETYKQGTAKLRKSWNMAKVTLSPRRSMKSGTLSAWRYFRKAGYTFDPGSWSDMAAQTAQIEEKLVEQEEHYEAWLQHLEPMHRE